MRPITCLYLLLVIGFVLSSCVPVQSTMTPMRIETQPSTPISSTKTSTSTPTFTTTRTPTYTHTPTPSFTPTESGTPTQPATLDPEQAKATIGTLLQKPVDCLAPCFWGIVPGKTSLDEAKNIFKHLGLQIKSTVLDNKEFYGILYRCNGKSRGGEKPAGGGECG